jgi:hypothetical protein
MRQLTLLLLSCHLGVKAVINSIVDGKVRLTPTTILKDLKFCCWSRFCPEGEDERLGIRIALSSNPFNDKDYCEEPSPLD